MNDFLTKDKRHLRLFQDNIVIDKRLLKWRRAEQGVEKTKAPNGNSVSVIRLASNDSTTSNNFNSYLINTTPDMATMADEDNALKVISDFSNVLWYFDSKFLCCFLNDFKEEYFYFCGFFDKI